eukprot:TRINITY_DN4885_c0_g1_i6.p1 TRINITY_DN4885_c0_g1~~TRINITY_DN4885_c0_g1_i6.p1  ORF type:complete len:102 (+),score=11.61 TRINITY_DN4885_c0_g1_i6:32-337(+)
MAAHTCWSSKSKVTSDQRVSLFASEWPLQTCESQHDWSAHESDCSGCTSDAATSAMASGRCILAKNSAQARRQLAQRKLENKAPMSQENFTSRRRRNKAGS